METERDVRNDSPQFSLRWLLFAIAAFAIAFAGIRFAQRVLEVPNDAYAMWAAGDVLLDYMTANNADWPRLLGLIGRLSLCFWQYDYDGWPFRRDAKTASLLISLSIHMLQCPRCHRTMFHLTFVL